jgi:transcriptional regulator with XRE-family HTH domain
VHVVLLRRVIGDALRARRQGQHRTLREVSTAANVSLGYLSEIERGQKEASSELLAAICDALGAQLSELLREASDTVALTEQLPDILAPSGEQPVRSAPAPTPAVPAPTPAVVGRPAPASESAASAPAEPATADALAGMRTSSAIPVKGAGPAKPVRTIATDGKVSVSIRQDSPLKATLRAQPARPSDRDVVPVG